MAAMQCRSVVAAVWPIFDTDGSGEIGDSPLSLSFALSLSLSLALALAEGMAQGRSATALAAL
jgi:hypothetical protein